MRRRYSSAEEAHRGKRVKRNGELFGIDMVADKTVRPYRREAAACTSNILRCMVMSVF